MNRVIVGCMFCSCSLFHRVSPLKNSGFSGAENHGDNPIGCTHGKWHFANLVLALTGCHSSGCGLAVPSYYILATSQRGKVLSLGQCFGVSVSFRFKNREIEEKVKELLGSHSPSPRFSPATRPTPLLAVELGLTNSYYR